MAQLLLPKVACRLLAVGMLVSCFPLQGLLVHARNCSKISYNGQSCRPPVIQRQKQDFKCLREEHFGRHIGCWRDVLTFIGRSHFPRCPALVPDNKFTVPRACRSSSCLPGRPTDLAVALSYSTRKYSLSPSTHYNIELSLNWNAPTIGPPPTGYLVELIVENEGREQVLLPPTARSFTFNCFRRNLQQSSGWALVEFYYCYNHTELICPPDEFNMPGSSYKKAYLTVTSLPYPNTFDRNYQSAAKTRLLDIGCRDMPEAGYPCFPRATNTTGSPTEPQSTATPETATHTTGSPTEPQSTATPEIGKHTSTVAPVALATSASFTSTEFQAETSRWTTSPNALEVTSAASTVPDSSESTATQQHTLTAAPLQNCNTASTEDRENVRGARHASHQPHFERFAFSPLSPGLTKRDFAPDPAGEPVSAEMEPNISESSTTPVYIPPLPVSAQMEPKFGGSLIFNINEPPTAPVYAPPVPNVNQTSNPPSQLPPLQTDSTSPPSSRSTVSTLQFVAPVMVLLSFIGGACAAIVWKYWRHSKRKKRHFAPGRPVSGLLPSPENQPKEPMVYISYSRDESPERQELITSFACWLCECGVEAVLDRFWENQDFAAEPLKWIEQHLQESAVAIAICSPQLYHTWRKGKHDDGEMNHNYALQEASLLRTKMAERKMSVVPILLNPQGELRSDCIPLSLRSQHVFEVFLDAQRMTVGETQSAALLQRLGSCMDTSGGRATPTDANPFGRSKLSRLKLPCLSGGKYSTPAQPYAKGEQESQNEV